MIAALLRLSSQERALRQTRRLEPLIASRACITCDRQWCPITLVSSTLGHADLKTTSV